jgi:hypothetical protein
VLNARTAARAREKLIPSSPIFAAGLSKADNHPNEPKPGSLGATIALAWPIPKNVSLVFVFRAKAHRHAKRDLVAAAAVIYVFLRFSFCGESNGLV